MWVESAKGECNLGQHEIAFRYTGLVEKADEHSLFKMGAKEIAGQEGYSLTFMAKYDAREGNSCHVHISLRDDVGHSPCSPATARTVSRPCSSSSSPACSPRCGS